MLSLSPPSPVLGPGRPSTYSEHTVSLLCGYIRQRGLSDSAAARRASVAPSTLSRWKQEHEDLALQLARAREDFRETQLATLEAAAAAEGGGGWRAAAWLLERIFPEDYSPRAGERQAHRLQETEAATCVERAAITHHHQDLMAELHTAHPEDFIEEGLYAPADSADPVDSADPAEIPETTSCDEPENSPASLPPPSTLPVESPSSPQPSPAPPASGFQNSRNPLLTPDMPCLSRPTAASPSLYRLWQQL